MTDVPVDDPDTLRRILANTEALLLDFDGPICSVFAGFPAHIVADQLRDVLTEGGYHILPDEVAKSKDPFDVLKYANTLGDEKARITETVFRAHEVEAAATARATAGAKELIRQWKSTGHKLAIVSNNSVAAIETYLSLHNLTQQFDYISARAGSDTALLKPHPHLINQAIATMQALPQSCTLVGDSRTDIEAATAASVRSIGYANKFEKLHKLKRAKADAIVTGINTISLALTL
ncbi:HAD family hydrolase [Kutzneria sp. NPDC052558]|uniref:HAD family hydrolase n=1 Tax=Kutzneria sp. NPDC052558 TaxID=3364121 RepID=UPI0037C7E209